MTRAKTILFGISTSYLNVLANVVVGIAAVPLMLNYLGKYEFGIWQTIMSVIGYIGLLDFGGHLAVSKFIAEAKAKGQNQQLVAVISSSLAIFMALGGIALLLTLGLATALAGFFSIQKEIVQVATLAFLLAGCNTALALPGNVLAGVLIGEKRLSTNNLISLFGTLSNFTVMWLALWLGGGMLGVASAVLVTTVMMMLLRLYFIQQSLPAAFSKWRGIDLGLIKQILSFSLFMLILSVGGQIVFNSDNIIIAKILSITIVASYAVSFRVCQALLICVNKLADAFYPFLAELKALGDSQKLKQYYLASTKISVALAVPIIVSLYYYGETIINAWVGKSIFIGRPTFLVLTLLVPLGGVIHASVIALQAIGKVKALVIFNLLEASLNIAFSLLLVFRYGAYGVALGTIIAMSLTNLWYAPYRACREIKVGIREYFFSTIVGPLITGVVIIPIVMILEYYLSNEVLALVLLKTLLIFAVYFTLFMYIGIKKPEREFYFSKILAILSNSG